MVIKYCVKDDENYEIAEITNVQRLDDSSVIFIPLRTDLLDVVIENVSDAEYSAIMDKLFYEERADLTAYKNRTIYDDDSDD